MFLYRRVADRARAVLGVGVHAWLERPAFDASGAASDWTFGHLGYDLKNELEPLTSRLPDEQGHPLQQWFVPRIVIEWVGDQVLLHVLPAYEEEALALAEELSSGPRDTALRPLGPWTVRTPRDRYLACADRLLHHIHRGDIYEVNYCTERSAEAIGWDPGAAFGRLLERTNAPYAGFYRNGDRYVLCMSPERFLAFDRRRAIGQPMKGTRPRGADPAEDARLIHELAHDPKERAENIMALDVMRNDLSRVATSRSVRVEELCAVHTHPRVHQLVSTVSVEVRADRSPFDAVLAAFPMASMTGAPKFRAMQLIDDLEDQRRGLFSGTLGFFAPDGTADLNVVIRSLFFDARKQRVSLITGSALTAACDPQQEWEECELKARSVIDALR